MVRFCSICNREIKAKDSRDRIRKYCSDKCRFIGLKKPHDSVCEICGKSFLSRKDKNPSRHRNRFCSKKCMGISYHEKAVGKWLRSWCKNCRKIIVHRYPRVFCSATCHGKYCKGKDSPSWKGGIKRDRDRRKSLEMMQWRDKIFRRDDFTCQICLKRGGFIQPHHIFHYSHFKELRSVPDNGITLCKQCHAFVHKTIKRHYLLGLDKQLFQSIVLNRAYRDFLFSTLSLLKA